MAGHNLKSTSITNLDSSPIVPGTIGEFAQGMVRVISDQVTTANGDDTTSTFKLVRIPTTAKVKKLVLDSAAVTAGSADFNVVHSDSTTDGTPSALQGTIPQISAANNKLFGAAQSIVGQVRVDYTLKGTFTLAHQNLPLWQVLVNLGVASFSLDPGGFFDIQANITTTITTGGILNLEVWYVE
jgi:hypothetical protein